VLLTREIGGKTLWMMDGEGGVLVICCPWLSARIMEGAPVFMLVRSPVDRRLANHGQKDECDVHIEVI
jgi:hypothetical protein